MKTREELEVGQFREQYDKSIAEINKSEFILKNNLLKDYIENEGKIDLKDFGKAEVLNKDLIRFKNYESIEELEKDYEEGYRILAINVSLEGEEIIIPDSNSKMTIPDIANWIENKEDAYVVLRTKEDIKLFEKIKREHENLLDKFIPEISSFDDYIPVTVRGFNSAILNLEDGDYSERQILDFLNANSSFGVVLSKEQIEWGLAKEIKSIGISSYVDNISNKRQLKKLQKKGVFGGILK